MQQQIRFCTSADGTKIAYATSGTGPALLLTTSWVNHLQYAVQMPPWDAWIEALSREYTLLRYDARGCGLSDRSVSDFSLEASVADMEAVVEASGVKHFAILGVCSGGPPAIVYGVRHPQQVTGLILYGSWGRGRFRRPEQPHEIEKARVMIEMARLGWARDDHTFLSAWASVFQPGGTPDHRRGWCALQKASTDAGTAVQILRASADVDVLATASRLRCRALIVHAEQDAVAPLHEGLLLATKIPGARYAQLDSDNHILLADEPAWPRFLSELRSFLQADADNGAYVAFKARLSTLTRREAEILQELARGLSNTQIASALRVSEKTVRNNVSRIFEKLDVATRARAIVLSREAGFGRAHEAGPASRPGKGIGTTAS